MYISAFLVLSLAVSQTFTEDQEPRIKEIDPNKDISEINKDLDFLDGDILPSPIQRNAIVNTDNLWTSPIAYVLDSSLDMNTKGIILQAFDHFRLKTCMDFKPKDSEEHYINVKKLVGCYSYIGKTVPGQVLSLGDGCDDLSTVEHEFIHALGFYHEQARYDRDDHVRIIWQNIKAAKRGNFVKKTAADSTNLGTQYDYFSVMHYGKDAFSYGNGSTIVTLLPEFQNVIGQNLEMSSTDVVKINRLYNCNGTVAFMEYCSFSDGMCEMSRCSGSAERTVETGWEKVSRATGGPDSDHTNLGSSSSSTGYFMHSSTASMQKGDSAWLESKEMTPSRTCSVQCLQFYYYHSGASEDQLNIWIREFQGGWDPKGRLRLMGQITGPATNHWTLHHVPLNATGSFQVEFEVLRGAGNSAGGFSIDDINLSETECPHYTWQINDFQKFLLGSRFNSFLYSPRLYSKEGYAYQVALRLSRTYFGIYVRLVSGQYDDQLQWPCPWRQVTFLSLDQNPQIQLQMSKQFNIITDPTDSDGDVWGNPGEVGSSYTHTNGEVFNVNTVVGKRFFRLLADMNTRDVLKGADAIFLFTFQDLSPLLQDSSLPCPTLPPVNFPQQQENRDEGPCSPRLITATTTLRPTTTTTLRPTTTTTLRPTPPTTLRPTTTTTQPPPKTTTRPPPKSTTGTPTKTTTLPPTKSTTLPPAKTTTLPPAKTTTLPPTKSTTEKNTTWVLTTTTLPPPSTTDDDSIFGFSAGMISSPVLILLALLLLLAH